MHFVQPATAMSLLCMSWFLLLQMKEFISPGCFTWSAPEETV